MKNGMLVIVVILVLVIAGFFVFQKRTTENVSGPDADNPGSGSGGGESGGSFATYNIDIQDFSYKTESLTVKKGDTVVWTNRDGVGHTVTSDSGNEIDSALLGRGESYSHTFDTEGTFSYHCKPHPYMKGTIIVEG